MATQQERDRWDKVLQTITIPYDNNPSPLRILVNSGKSFPNAQAVGIFVRAMGQPLIEAWEAHPPNKSSDLWKWIEPAYMAAKALNVTTTDVMPFVEYIELVKGAREQVLNEPNDTITPLDVLNDLELDLKLAVLTARLGHHGIMTKIDERLQDSTRATNRGKPFSPKYLDLQTMEPIDASNYRTLSFSDIRAKADPGVATSEEWIKGPDESDQPPIMKFFAAQWVTYIVTQWEELYRDQLAQAHGCSKNDVRSELFADLNRIRQDYVHNRGKASSRNAAKNTRLKWFTRGAQMIPKHADYDQLYRELEREKGVLAAAPESVKQPNRSKVNAQVPVELVQKFEQSASDRGLNTGAALEAALNQWISSSTPLRGNRSS